MKEKQTNTLFKVISESGLTPPLLGKGGRFVVDDTYGASLLFATLYKEKKNDYAIICSNLYKAQKVHELLLNFIPEDDLVFFPNDELLRLTVASGKEILSQRLYGMGKLAFESKKILITCPSGLLRFLPTVDEFKKNTIDINRGSSFDLEDLKKKLIEIGYELVNKVEHSLQFASRGDILDVFSVNYDNPVRLEFYGDEVESIREFKISSQTSINQLDFVRILPATDLLLSEDNISELVMRGKEQLEKDKESLSFEDGQKLESIFASDIEKLISFKFDADLYKYMGFAGKTATSIIDYFDPKLVYITDKGSFESSVDLLIQDAQNYYSELVESGEGLSHLEHYSTISKAIKNPAKVKYSDSFVSSSLDYTFKVRGIISTGTNSTNVITTLNSYIHSCNKVIICISEPKQEKFVKELLVENKVEFEDVENYELPKGLVGFQKSYLSEGFELVGQKIAYIAENDLLGKNLLNSRYSSRFKNSTILKTYEDLIPGDYVVHEYYGIGQFVGLKTIEQNGIHRDYLNIAYAHKETLYIPLEQFRLVRKYAGREGAAPKLSHLSTGEWEKKKATIKKRINDLADKLYSLYEDRTKNPGFAFKIDDELQEEFEKEFPFELTEDQQKSLAEIKKDMESPIIMDRLLCGDVGFGKTEIAFRAAFKAINNGKQVAILCPTTLLARQHYEVAKRRFEAFGVRIAIFSRLIPAAQQTKYMKLIEAGQIDLIVGTHRLLSDKIKFKDLALLIVDEEQRFGVAQKEKIKVLKRNVDVLTLSATPIPRTLQMSMVGMRQLSQINTAPSQRMPVQTYVTPYKEDVVDELISRELSRNGQIFYVYNRVDLIYKKASSIATRNQFAKVGVVHGQMEKEEIEDVMSQFYDAKINVLVCTSIVENGIDIPNANMLIVEDADRFGLSQLYQIKGRVGRGNKVAYAYLMYREQKVLNEDAQKRLQAIQEFTDLGSGYKIAQRDLMIRGAGDLLGPEQAGFIDSVGLDLYLKMLNEAVQERKTGVVAERPEPKKMLMLDAYIPAKYADSANKIELYQELDDVKNDKDIKEFKEKIRDIYGRIPEETKLLIQKKKIDLLLDNDEFDNIEDNSRVVEIVMSSSFSSLPSIGSVLFNELVDFLDDIKVSFLNKQLRIILNKTDEWIDNFERLLTIIHKVYIQKLQNIKDVDEH